MIVYILATSIALFICALSRQNTQHSPILSRDSATNSGINKLIVTKSFSVKKLLYAFSCLPLFLVSALRWDTGTDTWHTYAPEYIAMKWKLTGAITPLEEEYLRQCYLRLHDIPLDTLPSIATNNLQLTVEEIKEFYAIYSEHTSIAFRSLERILIAFNADVQWLFIVTSLIIYALIFIAIYRQSSNRLLSILLFVLTSNYFLSLNIISQYIAIAICLISCEFAERRKPVQFVLLVILATLFHTSAIVFIPVYILPKLKIKPKWCLLSVITILCAAPLLTPFALWLVGIIAPKYTRYFSHNSEFEWIFFLLGLCVLFVSSYYYNKCKDKPFYRLWYYANIVGIFSLCFSSQIPEMKRINHYFSATHFMLLPLLIESEDNKVKRTFLKWGIIVFFTLETIIAVGFMNKNGVLPYIPFWQSIS